MKKLTKTLAVLTAVLACQLVVVSCKKEKPEPVPTEIPVRPESPEQEIRGSSVFLLPHTIACLVSTGSSQQSKWAKHKAPATRDALNMTAPGPHSNPL